MTEPTWMTLPQTVELQTLAAQSDEIERQRTAKAGEGNDAPLSEYREQA